jgi:hypothetical protein
MCRYFDLDDEGILQLISELRVLLLETCGYFDL